MTDSGGADDVGDRGVAVAAAGEHRNPGGNSAFATSSPHTWGSAPGRRNPASSASSHSRAVIRATVASRPRIRNLSHFVDDYVRIDPADVSAAMLGVIYPGTRSFQSMRNERLPPEHLFSRRLDFLVFGAISHIGAGGNWYRVAAEWIHGAPPVTALGLAEAQWRAARWRVTS